jgi:sec-independent protein translocase protein TatC
MSTELSGGEGDREAATDTTFWEHISVLRVHVVRSLIAIAAGATVALPFGTFWIRLLTYPTRHTLDTLAYFSPAEAFIVTIKVSLLAGFIIVLPYVIWQLWSFIAPGLYAEEKHWIMRLSIISIVLFLAGVAFAYFVMIPFALSFFTRFGGSSLTPTIGLKNYISFATTLLLCAGTAFQLPIVLTFLMATGIVSRETLAHQRGVALVIILITSAIFTPPDIATMVIMAVPLYALFEVSLWTAVIFRKK